MGLFSGKGHKGRQGQLGGVFDYIKMKMYNFAI